MAPADRSSASQPSSNVRMTCSRQAWTRRCRVRSWPAPYCPGWRACNSSSSDFAVRSGAAASQPDTSPQPAAYGSGRVLQVWGPRGFPERRYARFPTVAGGASPAGPPAAALPAAPDVGCRNRTSAGAPVLEPITSLSPRQACRHRASCRASTCRSSRIGSKAW